MSPAFRILVLADSAFTVEFFELTGAEGAGFVRQLRQRIESETRAGKLDGVLDLISASRSLTVILDPLIADYEAIKGSVASLVESENNKTVADGNQWNLPVCYDPQFAPDLDAVCQHSGLTSNELAKLHSSMVYDVLLIGFLPGFPFMAKTPEALHLPRRSEPRLQVPAGSVAIANDQTAIYPWESPGGWHLIGACPVPLFDIHRDPPNLLAAGDKIVFQPIDKIRYYSLRESFMAGQASFTELLAGVA